MQTVIVSTLILPASLRRLSVCRGFLVQVGGFMYGRVIWAGNPKKKTTFLASRRDGIPQLKTRMCHSEAKPKNLKPIYNLKYKI
jgi:hypothetical protein